MEKRGKKSKDKNFVKRIIIVVVAGIIIIASGFLINNSLQEEAEESKTVLGESDIKQQKNFIPETDYTCEEIVPEDLYVMYPKGNSSLHPSLDTSPYLNVLKNDQVIGGYSRYCDRQNKPGQNLSSFICKEGYVVSSIANEEGIVQRSYKVIFNFFLDNRNCVFKQSMLQGDIMKCKILSSNCTWEYRG